MPGKKRRVSEKRRKQTKQRLVIVFFFYFFKLNRKYKSVLHHMRLLHQGEVEVISFFLFNFVSPHDLEIVPRQKDATTVTIRFPVNPQARDLYPPPT